MTEIFQVTTDQQIETKCLMIDKILDIDIQYYFKPLNDVAVLHRKKVLHHQKLISCRESQFWSSNFLMNIFWTSSI